MQQRLILILMLVGACSTDEEGSTKSSKSADAGQDAGAQSCESWVVAYDFVAGTQFDIRETPFGAGDSTEDVGPGSLTLRFGNRDGELEHGVVTLIDYQLEMDFSVQEIATDVSVRVGPVECGAATGRYDGDRIRWSTSVAGYETTGTITCNNPGPFVCPGAMLEPGVPERRDGNVDQPLTDFVFTSSTSTVPPGGFVMDWVEVKNNDPGETYLRLAGQETERRCVAFPTCP